MLLEYDPSFKISVIVTCHNYEDYLQECLDSIRNQTRAPNEVIIVNDKPTDSDAISEINTYSYTILNTNYGDPLQARKHGLINSKFEHFCFIDADDIIEPDYIKNAIDILKGGSADLIYSDMDYFNSTGIIKSIEYPAKIDPGTISLGNFCHIGCIAKKEYALNSGAMDHDLSWNLSTLGNQKMSYHEDWVMWRKIINSNNLKIAKQCSKYLARKHHNNKSAHIDNLSYFEARGTLADQIAIVITDYSNKPLPDIQFPSDQINLIFLGTNARDVYYKEQDYSTQNTFNSTTFINDMPNNNLVKFIDKVTSHCNPEYILFFDDINQININLLSHFELNKGIFVHNTNYSFLAHTAVCWPPIKNKNFDDQLLQHLNGIYTS